MFSSLWRFFLPFFFHSSSGVPRECAHHRHLVSSFMLSLFIFFSFPNSSSLGVTSRWSRSVHLVKGDSVTFFSSLLYVCLVFVRYGSLLREYTGIREQKEGWEGSSSGASRFLLEAACPVYTHPIRSLAGKRSSAVGRQLGCSGEWIKKGCVAAPPGKRDARRAGPSFFELFAVRSERVATTKMFFFSLFLFFYTRIERTSRMCL